MTKQVPDNLVSRLTTAAPSAYANRCIVGRVLRSLTDAERTAVEEALERVKIGLVSKKSGTSGYTATWLANTLTEFGHKVSDNCIRRHLHGACSCDS